MRFRDFGVASKNNQSSDGDEDERQQLDGADPIGELVSEVVMQGNDLECQSQ